MKRFATLVILMLALTVSGCTAARERAPVLVAQGGLATVKSVGDISGAVSQLQQAGAMPIAVALRVQEGLLNVNTGLRPLPDILRTIDAAQKAGAAEQGDVDKAVAILQVVSGEISVLLAGVPVTDATKALIELVRAGQTTLTTVLVEVARLKQ